MSFYIGDIVEAQYHRDNDTPLTIYYIIIDQTDDDLYTLRLVYNDPGRYVYCNLQDSRLTTYRKVEDGTDSGNVYED